MSLQYRVFYSLGVDVFSRDCSVADDENGMHAVNVVSDLSLAVLYPDKDTAQQGEFMGGVLIEGGTFKGLAFDDTVTRSVDAEHIAEASDYPQSDVKYFTVFGSQRAFTITHRFDAPPFDLNSSETANQGG